MLLYREQHIKSTAQSVVDMSLKTCIQDVMTVPTIMIVPSIALRQQGQPLQSLHQLWHSNRNQGLNQGYEEAAENAEAIGR